MARDLIELAEHLQEACLARGLTVAVAESCTGGLICAAITEISGSSGYFLGGVVSYSNDAKEALLDVPREMLRERGAVSGEVAAAMATGARARFGADLAVSVTGIAGPDGGSPEKPVGLVHLGLARGMDVVLAQEQFAGDRAAIRQAAALRGLGLLHAAANQGAS